MNHLVARLSCVRLISCYPDAISANCCEAWAWPLTERSPTAVPTSTAGPHEHSRGAQHRRSRKLGRGCAGRSRPEATRSCWAGLLGRVSWTSCGHRWDRGLLTDAE